MTVVWAGYSQGFCTLHLEGALRVPVNHDLRHNVRTLLRTGERTIVLDLARVSRIDAAGVGELVRAYNMTKAVNGWLRIVHATARVRDILTRVGLFDLLSGGGPGVAADARRPLAQMDYRWSARA